MTEVGQRLAQVEAKLESRPDRPRHPRRGAPSGPPGRLRPDSQGARWGGGGHRGRGGGVQRLPRDHPAPGHPGATTEPPPSCSARTAGASSSGRSSPRTQFRGAPRVPEGAPSAGGSEGQLSVPRRRDLLRRRLLGESRARAGGRPSSSTGGASASCPGPSRTPPTSAWRSWRPPKGWRPSPGRRRVRRAQRQRLRRQLLPRSLVGALGADGLDRRRQAAGRQPRSMGAPARRDPPPRRALAQGARPQRRSRSTSAPTLSPARPSWRSPGGRTCRAALVRPDPPLERVRAGGPGTGLRCHPRSSRIRPASERGFRYI